MPALRHLQIPDALLVFIHGAALYLPAVAAFLVAFLTASHADLKYWIALQRVPTPRPASESQAKKLSALQRVSVLLFVIYVVASSFSVAIYEIAFPLVPFFWLFSWMFLDEFLGFCSSSAHRNVRGVPFTHVFRVNTAVAYIAAASSLLAVLGAVLLSDPLSSILVLAALVTATSRARCKKTVKLSRYFYFNMILYTLLIGIVGIICRLAYMRYPEQFTAEKRYAVSTNPELLRKMNSYWSTNWLMVPLMMAAIGAPLGALLRFDYHLASPSVHEELDSVGKFLAVEQPRKNLKLGPGVVIPRRFAAKFPKVYFTTALSVWLATQIGLILLCSVLAAEPDYLMPRLPFVLLSTCCCVFNIPAAVSIVAWWRGNFRELWSYEEIWGTGEAESCDNVQDLENNEPKADTEKEDAVLVVSSEA